MNRTLIENTTTAGTSLLVLVAPKFCCWSSALAAISSGSSYLAWVYPMRPLLFGLSFLLIGYSLFKIYSKANKKLDGDRCDRYGGCNTSRLHARRFAWVSLIFVLVMLFVSYL